ncbi:MAG: cupredoxin domain-containing protein [Chloroflexales bacterium]
MAAGGGYSLTRLEIRRGEQVVITFHNRDTVAHNLSIELPTGRRAVSAEPSVDAILNFPANDSGSFRFFCAVPGHTEAGVLVISE